MPLLAINLSDKLFVEIKLLVEKGLYQSFESFLEISAFNQLALERGVAPAELVERGHRRKHEEVRLDNGKEERPKATNSDDKAIKSRPSSPRQAQQPVAKTAAEESIVTVEELAAAFARFSLPSNGGQVACPPPTDTPSNERIFGQVNRFLPLKLACRWLANSAATENRWLNYDAISDRLADDASTIGSILEKWDTENGRKRDELLSTGLPRRGNSASRDRFLSMFLARITRNGEIYPGAICQYQLARFEESALILTEPGFAFAKLVNPILDHQDSAAKTTLAMAELQFLSRQIIEFVPAERDDMRLVLNAVAAGKTTPTELAEFIRSGFPSDWSESVFQTHISGLVARLGELGLLQRAWKGRHVNYGIGDAGHIKLFVEVNA